MDGFLGELFATSLKGDDTGHHCMKLCTFCKLITGMHIFSFAC